MNLSLLKEARASVTLFEESFVYDWYLINQDWLRSLRKKV